MKQADMLSEATERLFRKAGIGPGMRVLDVGSGAGDVALLARRLVGDVGEVIGTDRDEEQVAFAGRRARSLGYTNVRFIAADYRSLVLDTAVDAIVGRLVLVFSGDPVASLEDVCGNLRHGGIVAFQESIMQYDAPVRESEKLHAESLRFVELADTKNL
jgi:ubiquinone/menaquinone biosynthesis C-methylase UbiE